MNPLLTLQWHTMFEITYWMRVRPYQVCLILHDLFWKWNIDTSLALRADEQTS